MSILSRGGVAALFAGVAAGALSTSAFAQTALPPLDATVAAGGPDAPHSLGGEALARRKATATDTLSLLADQPGVAVAANGGISGLPVVRGLADSRVLVTIDGAAITVFCPNEMNPPGSYVLPARVSAITLSPTLSPVSAGGDNIGGVIAIATRSPAFAEPGQAPSLHGEAGFSARSVSDSIGASLSLTAAGERVSLAYDASAVRAENYRSGADRRVLSTEFEAYDQAITLGVLAGPGVLSLKAGRHFSPYQGFPTQRMDLTENDSTFADLRWEAAHGWGDLSAALSWRSVEHEMNFLADKGGSATGGMPMNTQGRDLSGRVAASIPLEAGSTLKLGLEAHKAELDDWWPPVAGSMMMGPNTYWNIRDGRRERKGVWAEWDGALGQDFTANLGLRLERVETNAGPVQPYAWTGMMNAADAAAARAFNARDRSRSDDVVDLTARVVWRLKPGANLEFGYARKTRAPTLYERYAWGLGNMSSAMTALSGDANSYVGDPDLEPEVAHNLAATLSLSSADGAREFTLSAYHNSIDDFVDAVKLADLANGFVRLRFANVDARLNGLDARLKTRLWETADLGRGTLTVSAAWVEGENRSSGDSLYHMTPLNGRIVLEQTKGRWTNVAELELMGEKSDVNALRREPRTAAYALANLRTSWRGDKLRVDLAVENLLDTAYALPLGGVSFGDFKAGGSQPPIRPLPGPGRSVNVGLSVAF
jgi:iron complex outermembrane receptor protein